jgi:hypothetical protein
VIALAKYPKQRALSRSHLSFLFATQGSQSFSPIVRFFPVSRRVLLIKARVMEYKTVSSITS